MRRLFAVCIALTYLCSAPCRAQAEPAVSAASAVLVEANSGRVLYEKDAHRQRSIASITKLMTALVAVESTPELDTIFQVKPEHMAEGSSMYLKPGERLPLRELLYGLLLSSGNDAALTIAEGCAGDIQTFVDWMNQWADDLGMKNTHFSNPNGLDAEGHYSTAYDMGLLARRVLEHKELARIVSTRSIKVGERDLINHNKLLWRCEGCKGMKTGYTDGAGRTLVSCTEREGMTLICVTLRAPDDWRDHMALYDYGFGGWHNQPLTRPGKLVDELETEGSLLPRTAVETASEVKYPLRDSERVRVRITLPEHVTAPVIKGSIAGKYQFFLGDVCVGESYLLYAFDVPRIQVRRSLFSKIKELLVRGEGEETSLAALLM